MAAPAKPAQAHEFNAGHRLSDRSATARNSKPQRHSDGSLPSAKCGLVPRRQLARGVVGDHPTTRSATLGCRDSGGRWLEATLQGPATELGQRVVSGARSGLPRESPRHPGRWTELRPQWTPACQPVSGAQ